MLLKNRSSRNNPYALWIRSLVDDHDWTFEELAVQLGASFSSVKNWYHGHATPLRTYREAIKKLYHKEVP